MVLENNFSVESFDPEVLREYDIRGIVGNNLNNNTAYTIGRTFGQIVQKKLNSNKTITVSILEHIPVGLNPDDFLKKLESVLYSELEKIR